MSDAAAVAHAAGFAVVSARGGDLALNILAVDREFVAVILDLVMPDRDGFAVMEAMRQRRITVPVIAVLPSPSIELVRSAFRHGASEVILGSVTGEKFEAALHVSASTAERRSDAAAHRRRVEQLPQLGDLIAESEVMHRVPALILRAARTDAPVLIEGEAGTGKNLVARIIHATSERRTKPFVVFDCARAQPREIEGLLFGARSSAASLPGAFGATRGGTLLLTGAGKLPLDLQARLLEYVERGTILPDEAVRPERIDLRLIVASSARLLRLAEAKVFREDLYYRLNVLPITLMPLRDRRDDIGALARIFVRRFAGELARPVRGISAEATELLLAYDWPGNVAELERTLYRAVALAAADEIRPEDLPHLAVNKLGRMAASTIIVEAASPSPPVHLDDLRAFHQHRSEAAEVKDRFLRAGGEVMRLETLERDLIAFALERHGGRMSQVARALGIGRSTLYRKIREHGFDGHVDARAA